MKPITPDTVTLPPTDPRYVDGAPGSRVPTISGMSQDTARERLKDAGFQVADQATPVNSVTPAGTVVGTSPSGQTVPGSIITIQVSNGIPPPPPPPPPGMPPLDPNALPAPIGSTVIQIPGLPPITVPVLGPPPPPPPP
jgi:beta-lactam-binding protein with PASTA domain